MIIANYVQVSMMILGAVITQYCLCILKKAYAQDVVQESAVWYDFNLQNLF